jgi:hypothetical protein
MRFRFRLLHVLAVLILGLLASCSEPTSWPIERFESIKWIQAKEGERYVYARYLVERKLLIGRKRNEVVALLGAPSSEPEGANYLTYVIKAGSGYVHILDVKFEGTELKVVKETLIRSD